VTDVRQGFYETLGAQRRLKLSAEFVHLVDEAARITQRRFDAGEASQPDVLQTEIQLNQVQLVRRQAGLSLRGAWRQLAALVGQPDMAQGELEGDLPTSAEPHDWDAVYLSLVQQSPELSAAQAKVCRARAYWDRQNVQPIPNISAQLSAGRDRGTNNSLMNAQVEIPLPIWNRNQGNTYAAYSEYSRASQDFERQKLALKSRLAVAARDYDSAAVAVDLYQTEILPKADRTLTLSQQAYAAGQTDFLQVLIVRRTYFESNLSFVQAQTDLAKSQALIDGLLLTGGLDSSPDTDQDSALRDQTLNGQ
jgi:cobalt-zinc-cadmium efflux system outer membrane protein